MAASPTQQRGREAEERARIWLCGRGLVYVAGNVRARVGGPASSVSQAHMVLGYYAEPGGMPLVLDNLVSSIKPASARPDLAPVFSFNMQGVFVGSSEQASSPVDRVSRWRELLLRMRIEGYVP